jgi:hypothetical protein
MNVNANTYEENISYSKMSIISKCMVKHTTIIALGLKGRSKATQVQKRPKNRVGYSSIMHFEGRLASGPDDI